MEEQIKELEQELAYSEDCRIQLEAQINVLKKDIEYFKLKLDSSKGVSIRSGYTLRSEDIVRYVDVANFGPRGGTDNE